MRMVSYKNSRRTLLIGSFIKVLKRKILLLNYFNFEKNSLQLHYLIRFSSYLGCNIFRLNGVRFVGRCLNLISLVVLISGNVITFFLFLILCYYNTYFYYIFLKFFQFAACDMWLVDLVRMWQCLMRCFFKVYNVYDSIAVLIFRHSYCG